MRSLNSFLLFLLVICCSSCTKEFRSPNPPGDVPPKTADELVRIVVGMKYRFAVNGNLGNGAAFNAITANGFSTREIKQTGGANQDYAQLLNGKYNLLPNNIVITELWSNCLLINETATNILSYVNITQDMGLKSQVIKYASLYKALAIGTMAQFWQELPVTTGKQALFVSRDEALKTAINLLDNAYLLPDTLSASSPYVAILGKEISLQNSLAALSARYNMMLDQPENWDKAIQKAGLVNSASGSVFYYNLQNPNPLYRSAFQASSGYVPNTLFGLNASLKPAPADGRIKFYTIPTSPTSRDFGFGRSDADMIPLYIPGEMLLIQAEAYVKKNDLINGSKFLDKVLTKTSSMDIFHVGAGLPAYNGPVDSASLQNEIYKNRCIELFMSGMKLEDSRRFKRPGPLDPNPERSRNWYPYPFQERYGNPNTPPKDPDI